MKKICFILPHMLVGGVEKSLLELVKKIDDRFQIDIYLIKELGGLCDQLPIKSYRGVIPMTERQRNEAYKSYGKKEALVYHLKNMNLKRVWELIFQPSAYDYLTEGWNSIENLAEKYDVAVCYHMHHNFLIGYVGEKISARKKVMWVHNDINHSGFSIERYKEYLDNYDLFVCVSKQIKKELTEHLPCYKERTVVFHNIIDIREIRSKAREYKPEEFAEKNIFKLITLARLEYEKGIDMAIKVAKMMQESDIQFVWVMLGEGTLKRKLLTQIRKEHLEEKCLLLGNKKNPYPYLEQSDVFVQVSRHEGFSVALMEAIALGKTVLSTDVSGAREQIEDGKNGYIADINVNSIYNKIISIYEHRDKTYTVEKKRIDSEEELKWLVEYFGD